MTPSRMHIFANIDIESEEQAARLASSFAQLHQTMVDLQIPDYDGGFERIAHDLHRVANGFSMKYDSTSEEFLKNLYDNNDGKMDS